MHSTRIVTIYDGLNNLKLQGTRIVLIYNVYIYEQKSTLNLCYYKSRNRIFYGFYS